MSIYNLLFNLMYYFKVKHNTKVKSEFLLKNLLKYFFYFLLQVQIIVQQNVSSHPHKQTFYILNTFKVCCLSICKHRKKVYKYIDVAFFHIL